MIRKAIIEKLENNGYQARVRIPVLDRMPSSSSSVDTKELRLASICTQPGSNPAYKVGDIVFVDFENNNDGSPVILGCLYRNSAISSSNNLNALSLNIDQHAVLPEDTIINDFSFKNIAYYVNLLNALNEKVQRLESNQE